jgi:TPP-dependent indolepyruvate ferredoxin oxidoreductase alpha subunit
VCCHLWLHNIWQAQPEVMLTQHLLQGQVRAMSLTGQNVAITDQTCAPKVIMPVALEWDMVVCIPVGVVRSVCSLTLIGVAQFGCPSIPWENGAQLDLQLSVRGRLYILSCFGSVHALVTSCK